MTISPASIQPTSAAISTGAGPAVRATRSDEAFSRARAHSRRVGRLKIALPVIATVIAVAFFVYSGLSRVPAISVNLAGSGIEDGKLVMANPKLDGFTKDNLPYSMTASRALQDVGDTSIITLETIKASIPVNAQVTAIIGAASGVFDNAANTLDIDSPLTVTTNDGMVAKLKSAFVEIQSGNLKTTDHVEIERNGSRILAESMTITERGKVLVFEDRVRLTIEPNQLKNNRKDRKQGRQ